jgi:hypothetical protein
MSVQLTGTEFFVTRCPAKMTRSEYVIELALPQTTNENDVPGAVTGPPQGLPMCVSAQLNIK